MTNPKRNEAVALPVYVATAPGRIYLQVSDDEFHADQEFPCGYDVTWCSDSVLALEVKYVRADLHDALQGEVSRLRAALDEAAVALSWAGYALAEFEGFEKRTEDAMQKAYAASQKAHDANGYTNLEPPTDGR